MRLGAVVAVAALVALVVWLLVRGGGDNGSSTTASNASIGPIAASQDRLRALSIDEGHPIYWIGPMSDMTYELTRTSGGRIFIRYLPHGVPVGTTRASALVHETPIMSCGSANMA